MNFFEFLKEYNVASWLLFFVLFFYFFVEFWTKGTAFASLIKLGKKTCLKIRLIRPKIRRRKFNLALQDKKYLCWQKTVIKTIYGPDITAFNNAKNNCGVQCQWVAPFHNCKAEFASQKLIDMQNIGYEVVLFKAPQDCSYEYPFSELMAKEEVTYKEKLESFKYKPKKEAKAYYNLIKHTIPFPNNLGYMFDSLNLNVEKDKNDTEKKPLFHMTFHVGTYIENVCESHYLEYELLQLYNHKYKKDSIATPNCAEILLKELPHRELIHKKIQSHNESVFTSGIGRNSLASVSMMVVCKNANGKYDVLQIRRSDKVDAKVGFIQFIPSGGFGALSSEVGYDAQFSNASIVKGIFRELLEECFGEADYSGRKEISTETIYNHPVIKKLHKLFEDPSNETKMYFLGTSLRLVDLRHDICFLLIIDDEEIVSQIQPNEECHNVINFVSTDRLQDLHYWAHYGERDADFYLLNDTSAALWQLAQESENEEIKKVFPKQNRVEKA